MTTIFSITYQASCINALVRPSVCSHSCKQEALHIDLGCIESNGSPSLFVCSFQPSYEAQVLLPLVDVEVQTCNEYMVRLETARLARVLSSFGAQTVRMAVNDSGIVSISTQECVSTLVGELVPVMPPFEVVSGAVMDWELCRQGLYAAHDMASMKGNDLVKQGVMCDLSPEGGLICGANPVALSKLEWTAERWQTAPTEKMRGIITPEVVYYLRALERHQGESVTLDMPSDNLAIQSGAVTVLADLQHMELIDARGVALGSSDICVSVDRALLLKNLRRLRSQSEVEVDIMICGQLLCLYGVRAAHANSVVRLECATLPAQAELPTKRFSLDALITALLYSPAPTCTLSWSEQDTLMAVEAEGHTVFIR